MIIIFIKNITYPHKFIILRSNITSRFKLGILIGPNKILLAVERYEM